MPQTLPTTHLYPAQDRGQEQRDWLNSYHTFSFGRFYDPQRMGFGSLRVINHDFVAPKGGFPTHSHQDMEILTYVLRGQLEHRDSLGNGAVIQPGEVQIMSAGTGITHSEFNPSATEPVELLQIWVLPERDRLSPRYDQQPVMVRHQPNQWHLIAAPEGDNGAVIVYQKIRVLATILTAGRSLDYTLGASHRAWLQIAQGTVEMNGQVLHQGDGLAIYGPGDLTLTNPSSDQDAEVLLFDQFDSAS
ncbi:pirin family protein [Candidatus Synechococcus calcipolaris G9]|uniref:Pirin family protein n=1 Tax=Candidatus Synechococcus calcipolaris G9 TaxID=1497997 RepID=A0ABT6EWV0_9SYNE|nr:pirin family protein [Candidatus Synechococcus calcipolaris]MDG2989959.1 pirin family protein [Candidatus Synechococcus calcipolaris G9]